MIFQSTQPKRAATTAIAAAASYLLDFNPRSPSGLRLTVPLVMRLTGISIHAARVGCDDKTAAEILNLRRISIHAAQEGCDGILPPIFIIGGLFQSTQPKRAATNVAQLLAFTKKFQSTQPEWAATNALSYFMILEIISIHAARVGCDR